MTILKGKNTNEKILLYSDETRAENNSFIITTTIWGDSGSCRDYEKAINAIVSNNIGILGKDFKGFHANALNSKNWAKLSKPYLELIYKLLYFINLNYLGALIFLESREKYESNSKFLEKIFKESLLNRQSTFGQIFKHISEKDLIAIYKRADKIYNYLSNRDIFGGPNQIFEYFPDSSGKILNYKNELRFVESPGLLSDIPLLLRFYEIIRLIADNMANVLNMPHIRKKIGWKEKPHNQRLTNFEPKKDEDSYLIQSADIISNFFFHFIGYLTGIKKDISKKKANIFLDLDIFKKNVLDNIKSSFKVYERKCICSNPQLKIRIII